jgi:orotate phosphoribosyltransferase
MAVEALRAAGANVKEMAAIFTYGFAVLQKIILKRQDLIHIE